MNSSAAFSRRFSLAPLAFAALSTACARSTEEHSLPITSAARDAGAISPAPSAVASQGTPASSPFDWAAQRLEAHDGDGALVPAPGALKDVAAGRSRVSLVYTEAILEQVGVSESRVRFASGRRATAANALILPLFAREIARTSDIVLSAGASSSGLVRSIVVSAGASHTPIVRSVDWLSQPQDPDRVLEPGSFRVLRRSGELGTTLACRVLDHAEPFVLVARSAATWLGVGFAGQPERLDPRDCRELEPAPALEPGQRIFVAVSGTFVAADVVRVDAASGRVSVTYEFAGERREASVGYAAVARELPPLGRRQP